MTPEQQARFEIAEFIRTRPTLCGYEAFAGSSERLSFSKDLIDHLKANGFQINYYDPRQKP